MPYGTHPRPELPRLPTAPGGRRIPAPAVFVYVAAGSSRLLVSLVRGRTSARLPGMASSFGVLHTMRENQAFCI